jgi:hypothetical protein
VVEAGCGLLLSVGVDPGCATFMARRLSAVGEGMRGWWGLLLKRGADPDVRNNAGKTPVDSADCPGGNVSFRGCYVWGLASAFSCLWSALATAGIEP